MKIGKIVTGGMFVGLVIASNIISISVEATPLEPDWMNGDLIVRKSDTTYPTSGCVDEVRQIKTNPTFYYKAEDNAPKTWCVYHYKSFDITFYKRWFSSVVVDAMDTFGLYPREESGMAISFDGGELVPVENISYDLGNRLVYAPNTDKPLFSVQCEFIGCSVSFYDFTTHIHTNTQSGMYSYEAVEEWTLRYTNGEVLRVHGIGASDNGKWLSFYVFNMGLARMSLSSNEWELVSPTNSTLSWFDTSQIYTDITNDGNTLAILIGASGDSFIAKYTQGCTITIPSRLDADFTYRHNLTTSCPRKSLGSVFVNMIEPLPGYPIVVSNVHISGDGSHIWLREYDEWWYDVYPGNTQTLSKISYLALGDSYSSGEGDIDQTGSTHYLPFTNVSGNYPAGVPRELCHLSDRSYPFLLANDMQLSRGNDMQSVACSGAKRNDVLTIGSSETRSLTYLGQPTPLMDITFLNKYSSPRLSGLPQSDATILQDEAIQKFIPGRVQQIEMVRKYQPKVATIGVSGNDIDFAPMLIQCIKDLGGDCTYARPEGLANLGKMIKGNYGYQLSFYYALKLASPGTDFYAIGYPQFISNDTAFCAELAGTLTFNERTMIRNAVTYLNQTIKNAAATAGIKYIDIENVITSQGEDICSQSGMITGPLDKFYYGGLTAMYRDFQATPTKYNESALESYILTGATGESISTLMSPMTTLMILLQEAFHPNAEGHKAIYDYIHEHQSGTSLLDDECDGSVIICPIGVSSYEPATPAYFGQTDVDVESTNLLRVDTSVGKEYLQVSGFSLVERGKTFDVYMKESAYNPGTPLAVELHSDPIELAVPMSGLGGEVSTSVTIPANTSVGYHELSVTGVGADGSITKYIESIFVSGPADDVDGDGVKNSADNCEFITPSGIDTDNDGIDNSCDLNSSNNTPIAMTGVISAAISAKAQISTDGDLVSWPDYLEAPQSSLLSNLKVERSPDASDTRSTGGFIAEEGLVLALLLVCLISTYTTVRNKLYKKT